MVTKKDTNGRGQTFQIEGGFTVELNRQDAYGLVLAYCYQGAEVCELNERGLCPHCLLALFEAAEAAGTRITAFKYEANAIQFAGWMDAQVYGLRSAQSTNGAGQRWVVAK